MNEIPKQYLASAGVKEGGIITIEKIKSILCYAHHDFEHEILSFDDFSTICEKLWIIVEELDKNHEEMRLKRILLSGAELSWNIRHVRDENDDRTIQDLFVINQFVQQIERVIEIQQE